MAVVGDVWTARMGYRGTDRVDVTAKSGALAFAFAPSWALLRPYLAKRQAGTLTAEDWTAYVEAYTVEMRRSYTRWRPAWTDMLARREVTLMCYCVDATRCHRTVLAGILGKLGATVHGERASVTSSPQPLRCYVTFCVV